MLRDLSWRCWTCRALSGDAGDVTDISEPNNASALGYAVFRRRTQAGLNQGDLKKLGGPGEVTVRNIEAGRADPSPKTLAKLDHALSWPAGLAAELHGRAASRASRDQMLALAEAEPVPGLLASGPRAVKPDGLIGELTRLIRQYDGPPVTRGPVEPRAPSEWLRLSIVRDGDEHSEWDQWVSQMDLTRRVMERMAGVTPEASGGAIAELHEAVRDRVAGPGSREAALSVLADYISDADRLDIHQDPRARLLYALTRVEGAPEFLAAELERLFGEFGSAAASVEQPAAELSPPKVDRRARAVGRPVPARQVRESGRS